MFPTADLATSLPDHFLLAVAEHESGRACNEVDTEPNGFMTYGIFQLSKSEAKEMGEPDADLLNLITSTRIFCRLMEKRLVSIIKEAKLASHYPPDVYFYLAMVHNMGLAATLKTIRIYGLNAAAWTKRNPKLAKNAKYYNDCIGPYYPTK